MVTNIVQAVFCGSRAAVTKPLTQGDYGQAIEFVGIELPAAFTVYFSNEQAVGTAKAQTGRDGVVEIPNEYLQTGLPVYGWVFLHAGENDGRTEYTVTTPVTPSPEHTDEEPTPVQESRIETAIAALTAGVEAAEDAAESAEQIAENLGDFETAMEAVTAAKNAAEQSAASASDSATAAAASEGNAAGSATAAAGSATSAAGSASGAASSATAAAGSATAAASSAGNASADAAAAAGSAAAAAQTLTDVRTEGATQVAAITAEGARVIESIPSDYTELSDDVSDLKTEMTDVEAELFASGASVSVNTTRTGKTIKANGAMANGTNMRCLFYKVSNIDMLYVSLSKDGEAVCEFCSDTWCSNPTNVITEAYTGLIAVPSGAEYFGVAQSDSNTTNTVSTVVKALNGKVDKINGKGLSANDYTNADKLIVDGVPDGFDEVDVQIEKIQQHIYQPDGSTLTIATRRNGYLDTNGNWVSESAETNKVIVYRVTAGAELYLRISKDLQATFEFNTSDWPASSNLVGEVHTKAVDGVVKVPTGASYLSVSQFASNTTNIISLAEDRVDAIVTKNPAHIRVGTFNVGHFNADGGDYTPGGTAETLPVYRGVVAELDCDILGIQEDGETFDGTTSTDDALYQIYKYKYLNGNDWGYTGNSILSDWDLKNKTRTNYTQQYHTTRNYSEADITISGKPVHLVCTHFEAHDKSITSSQVDELIAHLALYDSVIVFGDFNPWNRVNGEPPAGEAENAEYVWKAEFKKWTDAGYKLANTGYFGNFHTFVGMDETQTGVWPWDNIAVTGNIEIKQVGILPKDWMQDHCPLWAELVVYDPE